MTLLLKYCKKYEGIKIEKFDLVHFSRELVIRFLDHLENNLNYSIASRNQRLAVIHAFFRFLLRENVSYISQAQEILGIPMKKKTKRPPVYLTLDAIELLLQQPDKLKIDELRDLALITVMYDTGARVQEIIDLTVSDIRIVSPPVAILHGKGNKTRIGRVDKVQNCKKLSVKYTKKVGERASFPFRKPAFSCQFLCNFFSRRTLSTQPNCPTYEKNPGVD